MRIQVKLFATLAPRVAGTTAGVPFEVALPAAAMVATLVDHLKLPADEVKVVFVNGRARLADWTLHPDDEVGIFPPVGGG